MKKIIALLLVLVSVFALAACNLVITPTPPACTTHTDANGDGKCDTCQADMSSSTPECTTHSDVNPKDGKCDTCGATVQGTEPEPEPEGLNLTPITDAIAATTYTSATVTTSIDSEYGTLTGEYTVTIDENGTAAVAYSYEQFTTVSEENAGKPMKETVSGTATIDAQGNVTSGSVGSQITAVSALKLNLNKDKLTDAAIASGVLSATVNTADTASVLGTAIGADVSLVITVSGGKVSTVAYSYELAEGSVSVTCAYN